MTGTDDEPTTEGVVTVGELIDALSRYPRGLEVYIRDRPLGIFEGRFEIDLIESDVPEGEPEMEEFVILTLDDDYLNGLLASYTITAKRK